MNLTTRHVFARRAVAAWPRKERGSAGGHGSGDGGAVMLGFVCEGIPKEKSDPTVHAVSNALDQLTFMCIRRFRINPMGPNKLLNFNYINSFKKTAQSFILE